MAVTVVTAAQSARLTRIENVQEDLGISTDTALLNRFIDEASAAIVSYCHRPFAREDYSETIAGYGGVHLMLTCTPIVGTPSGVSYDSTVITDFTVADAGAGTLYRRGNFGWTAQSFPGLSAGGAFLDLGAPIPVSEEPRYLVLYRAGYLLPDQNLLGTRTVSASSVDNSLNDSAARFPSQLALGDVVRTSGFTNGANNARLTVVGTPTTSKVIVAGSVLVNETAGAPITVLFQSLPHDIEKAAIECVKSWYLARRDDSRIVEKTVGPMSVRYAEATAGATFLPAACAGLLRPWVRAR